MKRIGIALALMMSMGVLLASCELLNRPQSPDEILLAAMYNLTGDQASLDVPSSRGAQLAVSEANGSGGILGRPVRLLIRDGQTDTSRVTTLTRSVIIKNPSLSALFGFSDTDQVLAAAPIAADNNLVFVTSGATSPVLPEQVPSYLFLACFGDNVQAAAAAEWAYETLGARSVSIFYNTTLSYTTLLQGYFRTRFEELGGQVNSAVEYTPENINSQVSQLPSADLIFLSAGPPDAVDGTLALRNAGITTPILGGDGFDEPSMWAAHENINDVYFTTHAYLGADNPNNNVRSFRAAYTNEFDDEPDAFAALGYDTANLLMAAIERSGSSRRGDLLNALMQTENFEGVTGTISYQNGSRIPTKSVTILKIESGVEVYVAEVIPESIPHP